MDFLRLACPRRRQRERSIQWGGQFLVAAELESHEYDVCFTMGNRNHTPIADLMVGHSKTGAQFWVDVKAQRVQTSWWGLVEPKRIQTMGSTVSVGTMHSALRTVGPNYPAGEHAAPHSTETAT